MCNTSLLILLNYTQNLSCLNYTQKTALDYFCIYSNSFYWFKYSLYNLTYFAAGTAYGGLRKASDFPPPILINTLKHQHWSRHCRSCLWESSEQSRSPTWRLLAMISQIPSHEGGWAQSLALAQVSSLPLSVHNWGVPALPGELMTRAQGVHTATIPTTTYSTTVRQAGVSYFLNSIALAICHLLLFCITNLFSRSENLTCSLSCTTQESFACCLLIGHQLLAKEALLQKPQQHESLPNGFSGFLFLFCFLVVLVKCKNSLVSEFW